MTATKTVLETLEAARKRIDVPQKWCKGDYAKRGRRCSVGSLEEVLSLTHYSMQNHPAYKKLRNVMGGNVAIYNDTHTHAEVLAAFDAAIAKEKEAQHA